MRDTVAVMANESKASVAKNIVNNLQTMKLKDKAKGANATQLDANVPQPS